MKIVSLTHFILRIYGICGSFRFQSVLFTALSSEGSLVKDRAGWFCLSPPVHCVQVSGGLSCCSPLWSSCEAVVSGYFEILSSPTTGTQTHPPILRYSSLFQGRAWSGSPLPQWCLQWHLAMQEDMDGNLAHCSSYLDTLQLVLTRKKSRAEVCGNIKQRSWSIYKSFKL